MQPSILASIFYLISFVGFIAGVYCLKKTEDKLYAVTWIPVSIIAVMCYQALMAAFLDLLHITVNIISVGVMDMLMAAIIWWRIIKGDKLQKYCFKTIDTVMIAGLAVVVFLFMLKRYGINLSLSYGSVDGASHLYSAMDVVFSQSLDAMFYSSLHNALLIEFLSPLLTVGTYYKAYVFGDVLHLLLAGMMFYGTIRKYAVDRFMRQAGVVVTFLYLLGYPANSTIFGFSYLGMSLTVILCIITVTSEYMDSHINEKWMLLLLMTTCFAVFESYMLFVPIIYFGILIWMFVNQNVKSRLISFNTIIKGLSIFLIPTGLGLWYAFRGVFGQSTGLTVGKQISLEGGIYRNLFTNFLILIPFAVVGLWQLIKKKNNHVILYFSALEIIFTFVLFVLALDKKVSGYYYYKNYFLVWLLLFVAAYIGLGVLEKQGRLIVSCGAFVWCVLAFMYVFKIDVRIQNKNELLYGNASIRPFMEIYATNYDFMCLSRYNTDKLQLYSYCSDNVIVAGLDDKVLLIGSWEDSVYMRAVLGVWTDVYDVSDVDSLRHRSHFDSVWMPDVDGMLDDGTLQYAVVMYDAEGYEAVCEVKNEVTVLYENAAGYVAVME